MLAKSIRYLTFQIDDNLCAFKASDVKEINRITQSLETIKIRDLEIPHFDLRARLGLNPKEITELSRILILKTSKGVTATTVDSVHSVIDLYADQWDDLNIGELPTFQNSSVIKGIASWRRQTVLLLDLEHLEANANVSTKAS